MSISRELNRRVAGAVAAGGIGVFGTAGIIFAAGSAHADPAPMVCQDGGTKSTPTNSCTYQWCPGSPELKNMPDWDRSVCHPWYFDQNSPLTDSRIIEGFPPPRPPRVCIPFLPNCEP
ncbi:hypothetical protein H7J50_01390 [Mycobacterium intermedium]|nr:hypothetical protein [Mycobacterium intermedium]MCV6962477.1 hypothetical protein [Mycobacterium intermedium]